MNPMKSSSSMILRQINVHKLKSQFCATLCGSNLKLIIGFKKSFWIKDVNKTNRDIPLLSVKQKVRKFFCSKIFKRYTMIAYNMKSFNGCFMLQYMAENCIRLIQIFSDLKIIALDLKPLQIR